MTYRTSRFLAAATFLVAMTLGPILNGQITISVNDSTVNVGTNEVVIFSASGTDLVDNLTFVSVIDQLAGTGPDIVDVTGLGFFDGISPTFGGGITPAESPQAVISLFNNLGASQSINGTDFVAVELDTSGLAVGDTFNIGLAFGPQSTVFSGNGAEVGASFPSTFLITVEDDILCGDVDQDGDIDFNDIGPFINVLVSGVFFGPADVNKDGAVTFEDISPFISLLTAQ